MFNLHAFLLYVIIACITPGPNNILSMSNGIRVGIRRATPFNLGILCGITVVFGLCTLLCANPFRFAAYAYPAHEMCGCSVYAIFGLENL